MNDILILTCQLKSCMFVVFCVQENQNSANNFMRHNLWLGCDFEHMTISKCIHIKRVKLSIWLAKEDATIIWIFIQSNGGRRCISFTHARNMITTSEETTNWIFLHSCLPDLSLFFLKQTLKSLARQKFKVDRIFQPTRNGMTWFSFGTILGAQLLFDCLCLIKKHIVECKWLNSKKIG